MFESMSEIAEHYDVSAKAVGEALYVLGIRDPEHTVQKGFPHEQYITHGIALPVENKQGEVRYFHYNIDAVKEEFEKVLTLRQKAKMIRQKKHDSAHILQEGLAKIETLLGSLSDHNDQPEFKQIKIELSTLRSHLIATNIDLALPLDAKAKTLLEQLQKWRKKEASKQDKPAFTILGNTVLHYLAYYQPNDENELLGIKGIGEKKETAYGIALLKIIAEVHP